ncbi:hypothetical protein D047_2631B, partial [Vibrio parahaemolyticus VPTS-2010_2]
TPLLLQHPIRFVV